MSYSIASGRHASGARLDRLPLGSWHYRLLALITAGLFVDTFELYSAGAVLAALIGAGWSTVSLNATFLSVTFVGLTVGAWGAGVIGDRYGRRFCYQLNLLVFGLASVAGAFAPGMSVLIGLRFLMGLGLGAEIVVGYATMAEFIPARRRGLVVTITVLLANASSLLALLTASWVVPTLGWRWMFLLPGVAALAIWLLRRSLPESPRWLEAAGRAAEADEVLRAVEAATVRGGLPPVTEASPVPEPVAVMPLRALFIGSAARRTLVGAVLTVTTGFAINGFLQWLPTFYLRQGVSFRASLQLPIIMSVGLLAGAAVAIWSVDRVGRRFAVVVPSVCAGLLCGLFVLSNGGVLAAVAFLLAAALGAGSSVASNVYLPELFETGLRLRGVGFCSAAGRLATASVQFVLVAAYASGGLPVVVAMLAGAVLIQAAVVLLLGPDTGGKSLEMAATPGEVAGVLPAERTSLVPDDAGATS